MNKKSHPNNTVEQLNWAGKIAHFFIKNSQLSILLIVTIFIWGIVSFILTPKQYDPKITAPSYQVFLEAPSAESAEFYDRITRVFEDGILDIPTVEDVMSTTTEGGSAVITVNYYVGEDEEESNIKLRQKVDELRNDVPGVVNKVERITILAQDPDDVPIVTLALLSDQNSLVTMREYAVDYAEVLKKVPQVTNVQIHGGIQKELKITLDPDKLTQFKIDPGIVVGKVGQNSYRYFVSDEFIKEPGDDEARSVVEVNALFENEEEARNVVITKVAGKPVLLKDIATVEHTAVEQKRYIRYKDKDYGEHNVVYISLAKEEGSNIAVVSNAILQRAEELNLPEDIVMQTVRNDGEVANKEIQDLTISLFLAIGIVAIILFLFLGWRPALTAAMAIPLTISVVFGIALISGETINRITLFALILSLGLLVDNATVIVENAVRHISMRKADRHLAVAKAVGEVGTGLLLATATTLLAFFPMAFVTGMMGPYMGPIPFFVPVALIGSLVIAYSLNPFLISRLVKSKVEEKQSRAHASEPSRSTRFYESYKRFLTAIISRKVLRRSVMSGSILLVLLAVSLPAVQAVKFRMLPKDDKEKMYVYIDYSDDTALGDTLEKSKRIEDKILEHEDVASVQTFIAASPITDFNGMFRGVSGRTGKNQATIKINLYENRANKSEEVALDLRPELQESIDMFKDAKLTIVEDAPGPPVRSTAMVTVKGQNRENITDENREKLKLIAQDFEGIFQNTEGVMDIDTTVAEPVQTISFNVELEKAGNMGLNTSDIIHNLDIALNGRVATLYRETVDKERENVFVTFPKEYEQDIERLKDLTINYVPTTKTQIEGEVYKVRADKQVRLGDVVTLEYVYRDNVIHSENNDIAYSVQAEMGERSVTYAAIDILQEMWNYSLPWTENSRRVGFGLYGAEYEDLDTGFRYSVSWDGEWELTLDVFRDLGLAMLVGIFLIYAILVAQFRSYKLALLILGTVALGLIGVMPGYALLYQITDLYFNATSMIGVIALAGIVVNNAIIMVEYLNQLQKDGQNFQEALINAAATRLRPIVLTAMTTILGSLTLVSDPVWAGLGWSIVLGMTASTFLTLTVFPTFVYAMMKKKYKG